MPDMVLMPNGKIVIVNGGQTGTAGYGNVMHEVGSSNADNPAFTPSLYSPNAAPGKRFSNTNMPTSDIARLYHSVATLTPMGNIFISGSNPNLDFSTTKYATEYRAETLNPPYMATGVVRPKMIDPPAKLAFGQKVTIKVNVPPGLATNNMKGNCDFLIPFLSFTKT
jgi:hypothetical protein